MQLHIAINIADAAPPLRLTPPALTRPRMDRPAPSLTASPPGPRGLFLGFLSVGLSGFGGVLPFARRMLVEERRWLTPDAFNETFALCQSLPGPNIVTMSAVIGSRFAGAPGALAAVFGLLGAPVAIILVLGALYTRFGAVGALPGAILALGAAASGLVLATAAKMAAPLIRDRPLVVIPIAALAFVGVGLMRFPLIWVLLAVAPISIIIAWRGKR